MTPMEQEPDAGAPLTPAQPPSVPLGATMPDPGLLPTLAPDAAASPAPVDVESPRHTCIASGLSFVGSAVVNGPMTLAGEMHGNLRIAEPGDGLFTVAESGQLLGDARALNISVLGRTQGLLDAAGGKVALHATARVDGHIRYTHLQVNGADLNAQLERVRPDGTGRA